ncbi:MAG: hypothetical protein HOP23_01870 [Methylococcaceae bacterium]|nr:hypothetical protein [Methylococcaceae bacterium]
MTCIVGMLITLMEDGHAQPAATSPNFSRSATASVGLPTDAVACGHLINYPDVIQLIMTLCGLIDAGVI